MATELDHGRIFTMHLHEIEPARVNDALYKPVSPTDPEIQRLARSIEKHGLKEPLVLTADDVIISGHRRYVACQVAELWVAPCRREPIYSTDPGFVELLREYNRQRVKSFDEIAREECISADPEEAFRLVLEHRRQAAQFPGERIVIEGQMRRAVISPAKFPFLETVQRIIERMRLFWPLTERQIHYHL